MGALVTNKYIDKFENFMKLHSNLSQDKRMKTHKCTICDQEFKLKPGLNKQFDEIHDKQTGKNKCNICEKTFLLQWQLSTHMKRMHENKKHHKCSSCGKRFN